MPKLSMGQQHLFAVQSVRHTLGYSSKSAREVIIASIQHCWDHIWSPVSSSHLCHRKKMFSHWRESSAGPPSQLCSPQHIKRGTQCAQLWIAEQAQKSRLGRDLIAHLKESAGKENYSWRYTMEGSQARDSSLNVVNSMRPNKKGVCLFVFLCLL